MNNLFIAHFLECEACEWRVPMEYARGALGASITNKALKDMRAVATTRLIGGDKIVTTCNTCRAVVTKAVA